MYWQCWQHYRATIFGFHLKSTTMLHIGSMTDRNHTLEWNGSNGVTKTLQRHTNSIRQCKEGENTEEPTMLSHARKLTVHPNNIPYRESKIKFYEQILQKHPCITKQQIQYIINPMTMWTFLTLSHWMQDMYMKKAKMVNEVYSYTKLWTISHCAFAKMCWDGLKAPSKAFQLNHSRWPVPVVIISISQI